MTQYVFPDNTVLVNFTLIDRHDLVEWIVHGNAAWGLTVSRECHRSSQEPELGGMARWKDVFGAPLYPEPIEFGDARIIADSMRKPGQDKPHQHMGEAETVAIVTRRGLPAVFLTDDRDAARVARAHGITVRSSRWIIAMAEVAGRIPPEQARTLLDELEGRGRRLGEPPTKNGYANFVRDLKGRR